MSHIANAIFFPYSYVCCFIDVVIEGINKPISPMSKLPVCGRHQSYLVHPPGIPHCISINPDDAGALWVFDPVEEQVLRPFQMLVFAVCVLFIFVCAIHGPQMHTPLLLNKDNVQV